MITQLISVSYLGHHLIPREINGYRTQLTSTGLEKVKEWFPAKYPRYSIAFWQLDLVRFRVRLETGGFYEMDFNGGIL